MTEKRRVTSAVSTHNWDAVKQGTSEFKVTNNQDDMLLIDPEDVDEGNTHSWATPKMKGARRAPVSASLRDEERPKGGKLAQIPNEEDPAAGYLETEAGMPVIDTSLEADAEENEFEDDELTAEDLAGDEGDLEEDELEAEFEDLGEPEPSLEGEEGVEAEFESSDDADMEDLGSPDVEAEAAEDANSEVETEESLPFEEDTSGTDDVALVDADAVPDTVDDEELTFATTANVVHVIRSNRIIASMGPALARKVSMSDLYLTDQFQDIVQASIEKRGLRKGLVKAGFVLAKVKLAAASKATSKAIEAKVEARISAKVAAQLRKDEALEQSLAIAAVGINRRYFKDATNELRSALETELTTAGVRGASRMLQAAFQEHGVDYAKSILTLARKLSAMPDEVRNQYAEALDLTNDEDYEVESDADEDEDLDEDDADDGSAPSSVTAALLSPARRFNRQAEMLKAGVSSSALSILTSNMALV